MITKEIPHRVEDAPGSGFYRLTVHYPKQLKDTVSVPIPPLELPIRNYVPEKQQYIQNVFAAHEYLPLACFRNGSQGMCSIVIHPEVEINKIMVVTYVTDNFSNNPFKPFYRMDVSQRVPHLHEFLIDAGMSRPDGQFFLIGRLNGEELRAHVGWVAPVSAPTDQNYQRALRFTVPHEFRW